MEIKVFNKEREREREIKVFNKEREREIKVFNKERERERERLIGDIREDKWLDFEPVQMTFKIHHVSHV